MPLLHLIRYKNLLIVLLTQLLCWWCVILPLEQYEHISLLLYPANFWLLALSTVLIAAAGYIINDYFDIRIDTINRPEKVILERQIPRRAGIILHTVFNIAGLGMATLVAFRAGRWAWPALQTACILLLWRYSTTYKRAFMSGNIVVALMTALTILTLLLYEPGLYGFLTQPSFITVPTGDAMPNPVYVLAVYAYFAFVLTWMREIVKDMEDFKGDDEDGCVTMPIRWGLLRSVRFTQGLAVLALLPLAIAAIRLLQSHGTLLWLGIYTIIALIVPLIVWTAFLPKKATVRHYHQASHWLKLIMIAGIGTLLIYRYRYG